MSLVRSVFYSSFPLLLGTLAACGSGTDAGSGNAVEMRDVEVVDGTINDGMTDLDAAAVDGTGMANVAATGNATAAPRAASAGDAADVPADAEVVSDE